MLKSQVASRENPCVCILASAGLGYLGAPGLGLAELLLSVSRTA